MDGPNKGSFNEQSLQTITHKSSLSLSAEQSKTYPILRSISISRSSPHPSFHTFSPYCCIIVLPLLLSSLQLRWGSAIGMRANGNGYMAQIRLRAAINMIIPLEEGKESGYALHIRQDDSDRGKVKLTGFCNCITK